MKNVLLTALMLVSQASLAFIDIPDIPETAIGPINYLCETKKYTMPEAEEFFRMFKLNSGAFAINIQSAQKDGQIWFLQNVKSRVGQAVDIKARHISIARCPHCIRFKPDHLVFESSGLQLSRNNTTQTIELKMFDSTSKEQEVQLEADCVFVR